MAFYGCSTDPGDFVQDPCNTRNGRLRSMAAISAEYYNTNPDWTLLATWTNGEATGDIKFLGDISGDYPAPAPTEIEGRGDSDTVTTSFAHIINFSHAGFVEDNLDFWNTMNTNKNYHIAVRVDGLNDSPIHYISTKPASWVVTPPVEAGIDTEVVWRGMAKWKDLLMPIMPAVPAGLWT